MSAPGVAAVITRPAPSRGKAHAADRLTNGNQPFLEKIDQRGVPARRMMGLRAQFLLAALRPYDTPRNGLPALSPLPLGLSHLTVAAQTVLKQLVTFIVQGELAEAQTARGVEVDQDQLVRVSNLTLRLLDQWAALTANMDFLLPDVAEALRARRSELIAARKAAEEKQAAKVLKALGPKKVETLVAQVRREQQDAQERRDRENEITRSRQLAELDQVKKQDEIERAALERAGLPIPPHLRRPTDG